MSQTDVAEHTCTGTMDDDDLLTIDEATQRFQVRPTTLRRRIGQGAVLGAYRRSGANGPEWVVPPSSLAALGLAPRPRPRATAASLDVDERVAYWQRRAWDAEAGRERTGSGRRLSGTSRLALVGIVALLVVGAITASSIGGGGASRNPATDVVAQLTKAGDRIGYVGSNAALVLPAGRLPVRLRSLDDTADTPRVVVVAGKLPTDLSAMISSLDRTATVVLQLHTPSGRLVVYDRGPVVVPTSPSTSVDPTAGTTATTAPGSAPSPAPEAVEATAPPTTTQVVAPGEHFWGLAAQRLTAELGRAPTDAEIAPYWARVITVNQHILVEPGNPSLLLVGQTVQLPPP